LDSDLTILRKEIELQKAKWEGELQKLEQEISQKKIDFELEMGTWELTKQEAYKKLEVEIDKR
jgi:hypothetical protein